MTKPGRNYQPKMYKRTENKEKYIFFKIAVVTSELISSKIISSVLYA